ncbi:MAG TPA: hypothetical protein VGH44_05720 [Candidatus Saccharimonadia bacterium]|jgi:hypothetical protein
MSSVYSRKIPAGVLRQVCKHYDIVLAQPEVGGVWQPQEGGSKLVADLGEFAVMWDPTGGAYTIFADPEHSVCQLVTDLLADLMSTLVLLEPDGYGRLVAAAVMDARLRDLWQLDAAALDHTLELVLQLIQRGISADPDELVTVGKYVHMIELAANRKLQRLPS